MSEDKRIDLSALEGDFNSAKEEFNPEDMGFDGEPIKEGTYHVRVEGAELAVAQSGNPLLKWTLEIVKGTFANRKLWRNNMLQSKDNLKWLLHDLNICGVSIDRLGDLEGSLPDLLEVFLEVQVKYQKKNGAVVKDDKDNPRYNVYLKKKLDPPSIEETQASSGDGEGTPENPDDIPF